VVIVDEVYDAAIQALEAAGGYMTDAAERGRIAKALWPDGKLSRELIAKDADIFARGAGLPPQAENAKFFMVADDGAGPDHPFSGEKLSLVLTVYRAKDFAGAKRRLREILAYQGAGHSVGIHTGDMDHARELAEDIDVVRVLVNQAHTFGNGGSFENGLNFTLSMGCGTWGGNSISENLNWRHFVNLTHLVTTIPEDCPSEEALFGPHWAKYGK
jgi:sulfoacetaldehyde dehydrogenase